MVKFVFEQTNNGMNKLQQVIILNTQKIANQAFVIYFNKTENFIPGQIIGITTSLEIAPRLYSICSAPGNIQMAVLFTVKSNGLLTPTLADKQPGDTIWVTKVQGKFIYKNEPAWWIATGTGIAPFHSMFLNGQKPQKLIHGGRTKADLFFRESFESLPDYIKCSSQNSGNGIYAGRLTKYLQEIEQLPHDINYYLCGSAEMVVDVRNLLISKGVNFKNIITEIYF